ncbi:hypothetical protein [Bradyrhizobium sp. Arg816]|uniref:hypothetical protein n=1 Tax=Bradyrhizobium sp. Arg816 TaxID=2998491 RepID=UPI00249EE4B7|nr:hypothetical protein [Bradyrhizobium sp. Arg816]MDI3561208.1 hypothetical protein [Bradyrhizobium sp. Arg816]
MKADDMSFNRVRPILYLAAFAASALGSIGQAAGSPVDPPIGARIVELMQTYGPPDHITGASGGGQIYQWRLKATTASERPDDDGARLEDFFCDVTATVGPGGRVKGFRAEPANVGAGVLASAGAFGPLCRQSFGLKPSRIRHDNPSVMRR